MSRLGKTGSAEVLTENQLRNVLRVVLADDSRHSTRNAAIVVLSHYVGLRAKEISALRISDVFDGSDIKNTLRLLASYTKGDKHRDLSLGHKKVRESLMSHIVHRQETESGRFNIESALFKSQKGRHFSPNSMVQLIKNIYVNAGFPNASSHSGRRSLITRLSDKGVSVNDIRLIAGHSSISTTQRYIQENPNKIANIMMQI